MSLKECVNKQTLVTSLKTLFVSLCCVKWDKKMDLRRGSALSGRELNLGLSEVGANILPTQLYVLVNFKFRFLVEFDSSPNGVIRFTGLP